MSNDHIKKEVLKTKIKLDQNKEELKNKYIESLGEDEFNFRIKYLAENIKVDECYECLEIKANQIIGITNIAITEIKEFEDDYIILGYDEKDNELKLFLSQTDLWIS